MRNYSALYRHLPQTTIAIFAGIVLAFPGLETVSAQLPVICTGIPGCGANPENVIVEAGIPAIANIFLNSSAALSVIFVVIGGAQLLLSFGREEEYPKAKKTITWALGGLFVALTSHRIVAVIVSENYTNSTFTYLGLFAAALRIMTNLLNGVFLIAILIGGMRMITASGKEEEVSKGKKTIGYAIFGVIIINLAPYVVKQVITL